MYKVVIGGVELGLKDGFVLKNEYNEKLDSGTIVVVSKIGKLNIKPFDEVIIKNDELNFIEFYCVDNFISSQKNFDNPVYEYTINLFSETKLLERITLPSLSITKRYNKPLRSVWYYVERYCKKYIPSIRVKQDAVDEWTFEPKYQLDEELKARFKNVPCPEFSWNDPTLKEVLDDLLMVDDCIVVMKNNVISFLNLKEKGNEIDTTKITEVQETMASADYISDLTINMKNSIGKNLVNACEYASLRSESGEITTNNAVIITQHPIYNIKSVKACGVFKWGNDDRQTVGAYNEIDITPLIREQDEYNVLSASQVSLDPPNEYTYADARKYKNKNAYYKRGDNKIQGFGISDVVSGVAIRKMIRVGAYDDPKTQYPVKVDASGNIISYPGFENDSEQYDFRKYTFKIEYETLDERKMKVGKYLPVKNHENAIFDNQSSSYVNVQQQSIFEYAKANRLGNEIKNIYAVYHDINEIPNLGDTLGKDILFSREISYYDNYIMFKGLLTKNYILKNYFTGVRSKRRSWAIAKGSDALTRYDITKLYCEFSTHQKFDQLDVFIDENNNSIISLMTALLSPLSSKLTPTMNNVLVSTESDFETFPDVNTDFAYQLDLNVEAQGMSICFNFGYNDNFAVGNYAFKDKKLLLNNIYKYADDFGEFDTMNVYLCERVNPTEGVFTLPVVNSIVSEPTTLTESIATMGNKKPLFSVKPTSSIQMALQLSNYYKDNREIIKHTIQFEYCSDTDQIIVSQQFVNNLDWLFSTTKSYKVFVQYINLIEPDYTFYQLGDTQPLGVESDELKVSLGFTLGKHNATIKLARKDNKPVGKIATWGITDINGNLLLGVNAGDITTLKPLTTIYMNLLATRDDNVYNPYGVIIGKMWDYLSNPIEQESKTKENYLKKGSIKLARRNVNLARVINLNKK